MKTQTQIKVKPGDVILLDHECGGIVLAIEVAEQDPVERTIVRYVRLLGNNLEPIKNNIKYVTRLRNVKKLDRRTVAKMFEKRRNTLNEAERIVSDAMFEGIEYVKNEEKEQTLD